MRLSNEGADESSQVDGCWGSNYVMSGHLKADKVLGDVIIIIFFS